MSCPGVLKSRSNCRKLKTLAEAMAWLAKEIPKSEHETEKVQTAAQRLAVEARVGTYRRARTCSPSIFPDRTKKPRTMPGLFSSSREEISTSRPQVRSSQLAKPTG